MIADAYTSAVNKVMEFRLESREQRKFAVETMLAAFAKVPKKGNVDVEQRTKAVEERLHRLVEKVSVSFVRGKLVVKVDGPSETLLKEFRRGTDWYLPWDEVDETLLAAVLVDPPSN